MRSDPEPGKDVLFPDGKSALEIRHAGRPKLTDRLQLNRGMLRVCSEQTELFIGEPLNALREVIVVIPKLRKGFRLEDH
jgi:hypothetical protein